MPRFLTFIVLFVTLFSACSTESDTTGDGEEINSELVQLMEENRKLKEQQAESDSTINAFFKDMSEIEENLISIYDKEGNIGAHRMDDVELNGDMKERIASEINAINELMAENRIKINNLYRRLETAKGDITTFKQRLANMETLLAKKDGEINMLRDELATMNIEMEMLYSENTDMARQLDLQQEEINTAWFAYGTSKELKDAGVITKEGGFVGIGRTEKLSDDFNTEYFTRVDITAVTEFPINAKKAEIITVHPEGTYEFVGEDPVEKLKITDPQQFWAASKYMVIIVD